MVKFLEGLADSLILYVRALAWWHAVPDEPPSRLKNPPKKVALKRVSRMQMRIDAGGEPDLPPVEPESLYLVYALFEAGPVSAAGMGPTSLSWAEIRAWQRCVGTRLAPWEARLIRRLSGEYLTQLHDAAAHDAPIPWIPETTQERRAKVAAHIKNVLRG